MPANKSEKSVLNEMRDLCETFAKQAATAEQKARELDFQATQARREAKEGYEKAETYNKMIALYLGIRSEAEAMDGIEAMNKKAAAKIANSNFVFLIDGSGSMQGAPLKNSLDAGVNVMSALSKKSGANPSASVMLFGNSTPQKIDANDKEAVRRAREGLCSGTDLAPSIAFLDADLDKSKASHVVILSDGDIFDKDKSYAAMKKLLKDNARVTVDVVVISKSVRNDKTEMQAFIEDVARLAPEGMRVNVQNVNVDNVTAGVAMLLTARLKQPQPRAPKGQAPGQ